MITSVSWHIHRSRRFVWILPAVVLLLISSCATPAVYNVDIRYIPTEAETKKMPIPHKTAVPPITVALFQDIRDIEDPIVVGTVLPDAETEKPRPVLPKYTHPPQAIVKAIGDFLTRREYTVAVSHPDWNLTENAIDESWGTVLLGGTIDELFISCDRSGIINKYRTRVGVTIVLADIKTQRILYRASVTSNPSKDDIRFSELMMEKEINRALSSAVEKLFTESALLSHIEAMSLQ